MYKFIDEKTEDGKIYQTIELIPIDKNKKFFKAQLKINKAEKLLVSSKIFNKDGTHFMYSIDKFIPSTVLSDATFSFNAASHPKVEILDLR